MSGVCSRSPFRARVEDEPKAETFRAFKFQDPYLKALNEKDGRIYLVCIDGALACPREDCGGVYGFYLRLRILKKIQNIPSTGSKSNGLVAVMPQGSSTLKR